MKGCFQLLLVVVVAFIFLTPLTVCAQQSSTHKTTAESKTPNDALDSSEVIESVLVSDEPLPSLKDELRWHGGSYLYEPAGDQWYGPEDDEVQHSPVLRLPECWSKPRPITAFQQFLESDPIHPWQGLKWFGEEGFQWEPRFVGYGSYEVFGIVLAEGDRRQDGVGHQLFIELDLRITGTERAHVQFRPLGRKNSGGSFYQLSDPAGYQDKSTLIPDRWWIEGEVFSIFSSLFDDEFMPRDIHVVAGKFPFALHNFLLINDDMTGVAVNKNTLLIPPFSNLNVLGFYAFDDVDAFPGTSADVAGMHVTADLRHARFDVTYAHLQNSRDSGRDATYSAISATQMFGPLTLTGRALFKWDDEDGRGDGQLYVVESTFTRRFSDEVHSSTTVEYAVLYANVFKATSG